MSFETDKQTLDDLNILGKYKNNSVYSLFGGTVTRGGEHLLEGMFQNPLTDAEEINKRVAMFRYFKEKDLPFPGTPEECDVVEQYVSGASGKHWIFNLGHLCQAKFLETVGHDPRYKVWQEQVSSTVEFLSKAFDYLRELVKGMGGHPLEERVRQAIALLEKPSFAKILKDKKASLGLQDMFTRDRLFRCVEHKALGGLHRGGARGPRERLLFPRGERGGRGVDENGGVASSLHSGCGVQQYGNHAGKEHFLPDGSEHGWEVHVDEIVRHRGLYGPHGIPRGREKHGVHRAGRHVHVH